MLWLSAIRIWVPACALNVPIAFSGNDGDIARATKEALAWKSRTPCCAATGSAVPKLFESVLCSSQLALLRYAAILVTTVGYLSMRTRARPPSLRGGGPSSRVYGSTHGIHTARRGEVNEDAARPLAARSPRTRGGA
ncbi:hypothetical protein MRX96_046827 [Rhipicephalus microplus]